MEFGDSGPCILFLILPKRIDLLTLWLSLVGPFLVMASKGSPFISRSSGQVRFAFVIPDNWKPTNRGQCPPPPPRKVARWIFAENGLVPPLALPQPQNGTPRQPHTFGL